MPRALPLAGLCVLLAAAPALAQGTFPDLRPNRTIRILTRDSTRVEGVFLRMQTDSLVVRTGPSIVSVSTLDIASLRERRRAVGQGAMIGALAGAVVGVVGGIAWASSDSFIKPDSGAQGGALLGVVGVGI